MVFLKKKKKKNQTSVAYINKPKIFINAIVSGRSKGKNVFFYGKIFHDVLGQNSVEGFRLKTNMKK